MITFDLGRHGLARSRFAVSRLVELSDGLEVLTHPDRAPYARRWVQRVRRRVDRSSVALVLALVEHDSWYVPDFLVPVPDEYEPSLEKELAAITDTPAEVVRSQLELAFRIGSPRKALERSGSPSARDPRAPVPKEVAQALDDDGAEALVARVAEQLHRCWTAILADSWDAVRRVLDGDVRQHAAHASRAGLAEIVGDVHEALALDGDGATLIHPSDMSISGADGLVLAPSVFLPRPAVWLGRPGQPMIGYPARGRGQVWSAPSALADPPGLLGTARTALLADLTVARSTTELAARHELSRATVSYHLRLLHRAGLLTRRQAGRAVLYECSDRATAVLASLGLHA